MYNLYLLRGEFQHIIVTDVLRDMLEERSGFVQRPTRHVCEFHVAPETAGGKATAHGRGRHREQGPGGVGGAFGRIKAQRDASRRVKSRVLSW